MAIANAENELGQAGRSYTSHSLTVMVVHQEKPPPLARDN